MKNSTTVVKAVFAGLLVLCVIVGQAFSFVRAAPGQVESISVGVFEFHDESGAGLPAAFTQKIARGLAQKLNADYKDLLARNLNQTSSASSIKAINVEQLASLGKQQGVKFLIRGGLLATGDESSSGETIATVQLYAEVVSVESLSVKSLRSEGSGAGKDQALSNAIGQLAASIHKAVSALGPEPSAADEPSQAVGDSSSDEPADVAEAESDEDLLQLIAQAEALAADGSTGNTESLASLSRVLAALKAALNSKSSLLEEGKDTAATDLEIAALREKLQTAVSDITENESPTESDYAQDEQPSGEKKNVLARINEYAGEALSIIQKIQEIRAALRGESIGDYANESLSPDTAGEAGLPTEEMTEEITGVVTEMGEPVAGAVVTEPQSGVSAYTDSNGSYVLQGVAAGKLAKLVVARGGKQIAAGKVPVAQGRASIADFELKPQATGVSRPALRIIPSTVQVSRTKTRDGNVGVIKGVVRDAKGRPLARALVNLKGFAMARTNSEGQYLIRGVPPGAHQLMVHRSGLKPKVEIVRVAAKKSSESNTRFAAADKILKQKNQNPRARDEKDGKQISREPKPGNKLVGVKETTPPQPTQERLRGSLNDGKTRKPAAGKVEMKRGQLKGRILDARTSKPVSGVIVSIAGQRATTSDNQGFYAFDNLSAGAHQVTARKSEYLDSITRLVIKPGETTAAVIRLNPKPRNRVGNLRAGRSN